MDSAEGIIEELRKKIQESKLPGNVKEKLLNLLRFPGTGPEFEKLIAYIEICLSLPFDTYSQDILDLGRAKEVLDKNHYGLGVVKDRLLEYLSVLILFSKRGDVSVTAPVLLLVGLVGTGKTSIAYSIADVLGRKIVRIPFGGLGDPLLIRGQSRIRPDAEPGLIIKAIRDAGTSNPIILLDEIDRVAEERRMDLMGVLVELLDPAQNKSFIDHYLDFPYDLSKVLFIATANNTGNIATAVMDRLEPIQMPAYSDEEKLVIGKEYLLPKAIKAAGLTEGLVSVEDEVWSRIIRPLGFEGGIRSLSRTLEGLTRKVARKVVEGDKGPFKITVDNLVEYLPS